MNSTTTLEQTTTHDVLNQTPPLVDYNVYTWDKVLMDCARREGVGALEQDLVDFGRIAGSAEVIEWGAQANKHEPTLKTHDRYGNRIDEVEYHPAWHHLMKLAAEHKLHSSPWKNPEPGAHVARAIKMMIAGQIESGHGCPISMTYSIIPALRKQPELSSWWEPRLTSSSYDQRALPVDQKTGALAGMAMTEKQGGSDVRANTTQAVPVGDTIFGAPQYMLTGHKWFCSAPMSDVFLVLAQAPRGLSCFLVPRWTPDGVRNNFFIQRLKDKLGNRSNASAEIELNKCFGLLIGEEGRGIATIIEMVNYTRLDCALGSAALQRQSLIQAIHHTSHRQAFGKLLFSHPLMQNVLADLSLESEAATTLAIRIARSYDRPEEAAFRRLATAVGKYWLSKRTPSFVAEALECLGGNGYTEDFPLARLFRESPLNSIWEGCGNVICLDVLRTIEREPECLEAFLCELEISCGQHPVYDRYLCELIENLQQPLSDAEFGMRRVVEQMALCLQASLLIQHSPDFVWQEFCQSRLAENHRSVFGTLSRSAGVPEILHRATPNLP